ncbi:MAG: ImmA/IrrE family metallo-endopeptidase [Desulfobacteria bacterium]
MRTYRTSTGPFTERPFFTDIEIENICTDELHALDLFPPVPSPIRIDRFIEKRFRVTPEYRDLVDDVLGITQFGPKGVHAVIIARSLDEEGTKTSERRIRTTLAHEAGHGLLHAHLFVPNLNERPLFGDYSDPQAPMILCRDIPDNRKGYRPGYNGRWWEYQANLAIGGFLLPRSLTGVALDHVLETGGSFGTKVLASTRREEATRILADTFEVNPVVARIRLQQLYPPAGESQFRL